MADTTRYRDDPSIEEAHHDGDGNPVVQTAGANSFLKRPLKILTWITITLITLTIGLLITNNVLLSVWDFQEIYGQFALNRDLAIVVSATSLAFSPPDHKLTHCPSIAPRNSYRYNPYSIRRITHPSQYRHPYYHDNTNILLRGGFLPVELPRPENVLALRMEWRKLGSYHAHKSLSRQASCNADSYGFCRRSWNLHRVGLLSISSTLPVVIVADPLQKSGHRIDSHSPYRSFQDSILEKQAV